MANINKETVYTLSGVGSDGPKVILNQRYYGTSAIRLYITDEDGDWLEFTSREQFVNFINELVQVADDIGSV